MGTGHSGRARQLSEVVEIQAYQSIGGICSPISAEIGAVRPIEGRRFGAEFIKIHEMEQR